MNKLKMFFNNKNVNDFVRGCLLILLFCYIAIRVLDSMGVFVEEINCSVENVAKQGDKECFMANGYFYDDAFGQSNEKAFEGNYSVKLTPEHQYGFSISLGIPKAKEVYEGSVWFYEIKISLDTAGWPYLVSAIGNQFWKGAKDVEEKKNGWGKLEFKIIIPDSVYKTPLMVYCWNNTKNIVYFDNMTIKRKNYMKFFKQ